MTHEFRVAFTMRCSWCMSSEISPHESPILKKQKDPFMPRSEIELKLKLKLCLKIWSAKNSQNMITKAKANLNKWSIIIMWLPFSSGHYSWFWWFDGKFSLHVKIFLRCRFIQMMRENSSPDLQWNNDNKMLDGWTQRFHRSFAIEWNLKCWPLSFLLYTMNAKYFIVFPLYHWIWIPFL